MYQQLFFTQKQDELLHAIPAEEYLSDRIGGKTSPFHPLPFWAKIISKVACTILFLIQKLLGTKLYVRNELRELSGIKPQLRNLLLSLIKKNIVSTWQCGHMAPDLPHVIRCNVGLQNIQDSSGKQYQLSGSIGTGYGNTTNKALTTALAELLERHSLCTIDTKRIVRGSFEELKRRGAVDPSVFTFFSERQLSDKSFASSSVRPTQSFGWIKAYSFIDKKCCFIPAQLVYIFYSRKYTEEPMFWQSTTSGTAAGRTFDEASCSAINEAVERDAFLIFWLNRIAPPQIELESITVPAIQDIIKDIREYELELFVLDITTDINIPSFATVLLDRRGGVSVSVAAATDFDISNAISKAIFEALQRVLFSSDVSSDFMKSIQKKYPYIETIKERRALWYDEKMIRHIDFFLQGEKKKFSDIVCIQSPKTVQLKLNTIKKILKEKKYNCYLVDVASCEARKAGLSVVKAIIPQLMPIYFKEKKKHLGVKRLYTVPQQLGYSTVPRGDDDFNIIPHPFP